MKYLIILLLFPYSVFCQNCIEKINAAIKSREAGKYELSIKQFQAAAAAGCDIETNINIENEILEVFKQIEGLKEQAETAKKAADLLRHRLNSSPGVFVTFSNCKVLSI